MSTLSVNPYQSPSEIGPPQQSTLEGGCYRDGKFLVVRESSELPHRCIRTNQVVESDGWRKLQLVVWSPRWIVWLLFLSPLVYVIVMLCTRKRANFSVSMGKELRRKITMTRLFGLLLLAGVGSCIYVCVKFSSSSDQVVGIAGCAAGLLFLTMVIIMQRAIPLRAVKQIDGFFRVKGCSEAFLETLPAIVPSPFGPAR